MALAWNQAEVNRSCWTIPLRNKPYQTVSAAASILMCTVVYLFIKVIVMVMACRFARPQPKGDWKCCFWSNCIVLDFLHFWSLLYSFGCLFRHMFDVFSKTRSCHVAVLFGFDWRVYSMFLFRFCFEFKIFSIEYSVEVSNDTSLLHCLHKTKTHIFSWIFCLSSRFIMTRPQSRATRFGLSISICTPEVSSLFTGDVFNVWIFRAWVSARRMTRLACP